MILVDYLILGIIVMSALIGLFRGFFPEVLSLATWLAAVYIGWNHSGAVERMLDGKVGPDGLEVWVAHFIVFAVVLILGGLIGQLVAIVIERTGLSGTDRALGFAFGLARGFVVLAVLVIIAQVLGLQDEDWWQQSQFMPYGEDAANVLREILPEDVSKRIEPAQPGEEAPGPPEDIGEAQAGEAA